MGGYSGVRTENTQSCKICLNFNFRGWGYSGLNFGHLKSEVFHWGGGGVYSGVNFDHLKSEVFHCGGIPE